MSRSTPRNVVLAISAVVLIAALVIAADFLNLVHLPAPALAAVRWLAVGALIIYASFRRTLTSWIVVAMVLGAVIGHDFPSAAVNLRLLAQIFDADSVQVW